MSDAIEVNTDYYDNGNKRYEVPRLNGQLHGLARWWRSDGKLREEKNFKNGKRHGFARWWFHEDGQLFEESNYKNGQLHGLRRLWDNGFITYFDFWHKGTELVEFEFKEEAKALTPEPNQPIFSTNQFLQLCQRKEQ